MARSVQMHQPTTGLTTVGFFGFSWTTLFFGMFPALFRGDFLTFLGGVVLYLVLAFIVGPFVFLAAIAWAFFYNSYYTRKLLERGYVFDESDSNTPAAKQALKMRLNPVPSHPLEPRPKTLP